MSTNFRSQPGLPDGIGGTDELKIAQRHRTSVRAWRPATNHPRRGRQHAPAGARHARVSWESLGGPHLVVELLAAFIACYFVTVIRVAEARQLLASSLSATEFLSSAQANKK